MSVPQQTAASPESGGKKLEAQPAYAASKQPQHPRSAFHLRFLLALGLSGALVGFSLTIGTLGYHFIAGFRWVDSVHNAAMILTGMGPVTSLESDVAKLFATAYALFSGVVFITATGILLTPIFHRVLHRFHLEERDLR
jgi:hypothetical protein